MRTDQKIAYLRSYVGMGHTNGNGESTTGTCFMTHLPDCFKYMKYDAVLEIVNELHMALVVGELSKTQRYMYWFLSENGILSALDNLDLVLEEESRA